MACFFAFGRYLFCVHVFACIKEVYFPWDLGRLSFYLAGFRVFCVFFRLAVVVFIHVNFVAAGFSFLFVLVPKGGARVACETRDICVSPKVKSSGFCVSLGICL